MNMMMGERDEGGAVEGAQVPPGPLALPGPPSPTQRDVAPIVPNVEIETADPVIAFGLAITKEEKEEGTTYVR